MLLKRFRRLGQIPEPLLPEFGAGAYERPGGEENEFEVVAEGAVPGPPDFELAFVGSDNGVVEVVAVAWHFVQNGFFITEDNRADTGEAGRNLINLGANRQRIQFIVPPCLGPRADNAHLPDQDIRQLGKFVDFCLSEKAPHGQNARVIFLREHAAREVGAVFQHSREFENVKIAAAFSHTRLKIENVVFPRQFEPNHNRNHERKKDDHGDERKQNIEAADQHPHILPSRNFPVSLWENSGMVELKRSMSSCRVQAPRVLIARISDSKRSIACES